MTGARSPRRKERDVVKGSLALLWVLPLAFACSSPRPATDGWASSIDTLPSGRVVVHNPDAPL